MTHGIKKEDQADIHSRKSFVAEAKDIFASPALRKLMMDLVTETCKVIPGIGGVVDAADKLCRGLMSIEQEESQNRLRAYALGLAEGYQENKEFRDQDVLPVMRKLTADDEAAKTEYYTRLTLGLGRINASVLLPETRYHFIRMVSGLTCYQIEFARVLLIRKTVPVCGTLSLEEAERDLTSRDEGMTLQAVNTLKNWGLMIEVVHPPRAKKPDAPLYTLTKDFHTLMELLFHASDFLPETAGLAAKETVDVILDDPYGPADSFFTLYLSAALRKAGCSVALESKNSQHRYEKSARVYLQTGILREGEREYIQVYIKTTSTPHYESSDDVFRKIKTDKVLYQKRELGSRVPQQHIEAIGNIATAVVNNLH
ncbi:hypothetical protein N5E15_21910 [Pantoea stewartii]|uniref:hypothetical protein n=1 Tax=Pantoea stewartii TaxID=66269 RepID=UPI0021D50367|nr:hypothetical protein [Pantoea stewartii]MCU7369234.1 hypothetical protein [Pantoea stewartii]